MSEESTVYLACFGHDGTTHIESFVGTLRWCGRLDIGHFRVVSIERKLDRAKFIVSHYDSDETDSRDELAKHSVFDVEYKFDDGCHLRIFTNEFEANRWLEGMQTDRILVQALAAIDNHHVASREDATSIVQHLVNQGLIAIPEPEIRATSLKLELGSITHADDAILTQVVNHLVRYFKITRRPDGT